MLRICNETENELNASIDFYLLPVAILLGSLPRFLNEENQAHGHRRARLKVTPLAVIWTVAIGRQVSSCQTKCWLYRAAAARACALLACKRKRTFLCIILKVEHFQSHFWHLQALRMLLLNKETKRSEDTEGSLSAQWDDVVSDGHLRPSHSLVAFERTEHLTWRVGCVPWLPDIGLYLDCLHCHYLKKHKKPFKIIWKLMHVIFYYYSKLFCVEIK